MPTRDRPASWEETFCPPTLIESLDELCRPLTRLVTSGKASLKRDSVVNVTQPVTIDRADLVGRLDRLPRRLVQDVDAGLRRVLDL